MTTVKDMWAKKATFTNKASEISRTLCLSGLAVVWIFRSPTEDGSTLHPTLLWAAGLIVLALFLDLIQYVVGAKKTGEVARSRELELHEAQKPHDTPVQYPEDHPGPMNRIWGTKIAVVLGAWALLLVHVIGKALTATLPAVTP